MVKMNVKFETPEQLVEFSRMCQKVEADTLIEDTAHKLIIDGKSVMGMMTVTLNQKMIFVVDGSDEKEVLSTFEKYRTEDMVQVLCELVTVSREYQKRKKSLDNGKTRF